MAEYQILKLLDDRGIKYNNSGSNNVKIRCFSGMHEDKSPSLMINVTTGEYHCFVCHAKGNIVGYFIENKEITYADAASYEKTIYLKKEDKSEQEIFLNFKQRLQRKKVETIIEVKEPSTIPITYNHYLFNRGFTIDDIKKWNIQLIQDKESNYNGWIYIPIYFNNKLRTYFLRSTKNSNKIYGYTYNEITKKNEGYPRRDILYGYDNIKDFNQVVYLFEGIFDMIWFSKTNKQSLALLGNIITKEQLQYLKKFKKIVLALDNDKPSLNIVKSSLPLLYTNIQVTVWKPPIGKKDANECTMRQLIEQTYKEVPLKKFIESDEYMLWSLTNATTKSNIRND